MEEHNHDSHVRSGTKPSPPIMPQTTATTQGNRILIPEQSLLRPLHATRMQPHVQFHVHAHLRNHGLVLEHARYMYGGNTATPPRTATRQNRDSEKTLVIRFLPKCTRTWAKVTCYVQVTQTTRSASNPVTAVVNWRLLDSG